jgi:cold shock CspA family protein
MGRSQETSGKKEVRNKKDKKRQEKEKKRALKRTEKEKSSFDDMIAYVDEFGRISSTPPDPSKKTEIIAENIDPMVTLKRPENASDLMRKGVVTFFDEARGFGFIRDLESNQRIFVHASVLLEPVIENNVVVFEIVKGNKGPSAIKVKLFKEQSVDNNELPISS